MATDTSRMMAVSFRLSRRRLSLEVPCGLCAEFVAVEFTIVTAEWLRVEQRWWAWCAAWREVDAFLSP